MRTSMMVLLLLAGAVSADAACDFPVNVRATGDRISVTWSPVAGATQYRVEELVSSMYRGTPQPTGRYTLVTLPVGSPTATIFRRRTADEQFFTYRVYAELAGANFTIPNTLVCTGLAEIRVSTDQSLVPLSLNRIVPLVGSTRGANGSLFKTSLQIHLPPNLAARIWFRPVGQVASTLDRYLEVPARSGEAASLPIYYDDIVAAIGATGTGSLEIAMAGPVDEEPLIQARVYNVTPDGTYGSFEPAVRPFDYREHPQFSDGGSSFEIPAVVGDLRRNVGFRVLGAPVFVTAFVQSVPATRTVTREFPANYTYFGSISDLVGMPVDASARVTLQVNGGAFIPFYSLTDNKTNDPSIHVEPARTIPNYVLYDVR
jgi:hypothetical protein